MKFRKSFWQEKLIYALLWMILFIVPAIVIQYYHADDGDYPWGELFELWRQFAVFLVAFLLHNFVLAPLFVYRRRLLLYFSSIAVLLLCFIAVQCANRPEVDHGRDFKTLTERHGHPSEQSAHQGHWHRPLPPDCHEKHPSDRPVPPDARGPHHGHGGGGKMPPPIVGQHDIVATIMLVLMLGMNLGVKLYFRQREDEQRMATLERQHLEQQLDFLRYQINPHFLMNTLNNIHALVDIEPEQAKETIVGLSKILRFVLYEGSKQMVPLDRELAFLANYIELMAIRVSDQVDLLVELPTVTSDAHVPPLIFITFVENAFKHGVSYQQHSFIDIHASVDDERVHFVCRNSKVPPTSASRQGGGVGLRNARKRLDLIYGTNYQLDISEDEHTYNVKMNIPLYLTKKESKI